VARKSLPISNLNFRFQMVSRSTIGYLPKGREGKLSRFSPSMMGRGDTVVHSTALSPTADCVMFNRADRFCGKSGRPLFFRHRKVGVEFHVQSGWPHLGRQILQCLPRLTSSSRRTSDARKGNRYMGRVSRKRQSHARGDQADAPRRVEFSLMTVKANLPRIDVLSPSPARNQLQWEEKWRTRARCAA